MRTVVALMLLLGPGVASAKVLLDTDLIYFQDSKTTSATSTRTGSFYSGALLVDATGKETLYLGAILGMGSVVISGGTRETFSHQDVILGGRWFIGRQRLMSLSLGYGVLARGDLKESSATPREKWEGTSLYGKVTVAPQFRQWTAGISLIYHQVNYVEKTVQGTTSKDTFQRTMIWPAISLGYKW